MKQYQATETGYTIDGMHIPNAEGNKEYKQMIAEIANGDAEVIPYIPPVLTVEQKRELAYQVQGLTTDKLMVALWEKFVEGRPDTETGVDTIQAARQAIKTLYPKV